MTTTTPSNSESGPIPISTNQIRQAVDQNQGQIIAQMMGGLAVGQLTVYLSQVQTEMAETTPASVELGQNPYQGLKAFRETDGDRFFGREIQTRELWQRFQQLHDDRSTIRVLPIYGPSGSGKSSLARAGLIPTLGLHPLPGRDHSRVVVLTPGNHPLEALATVLARIATKDPTPVMKTREFKEELLQSKKLPHPQLNSQPKKQPNRQQEEFDGLRRIADAFPDIAVSPLILLVDQFEELYTLCDDEQERHAFVENLLCAASDRAQRVSVILTMRSDFLGATQQHPQLNSLFSSQGFLVPIMQPEELAIAIAQPAKQAGHALDKATIQLLVEETQGQEGALPLLQFALTQIWEGLRNGVEPADTLEQIGGVGGALASEAKRLYESLTMEQQKIARSIFLDLIQLNEDHTTTRRRATISELITSQQDAHLVREVIDRFARPGVWILVTSANEQRVEMVEVAHEALIRSWKELQEWLKEHWQALRQKRKIEQAAVEWQDHQKSKDYLLQGRGLRDAREFLQAYNDNAETAPSSFATDFVKASRREQLWNHIKSAIAIAIIPILGTFTLVHLWIIDTADKMIYDPGRNIEIKNLIQYLWLTGRTNKLVGINLSNENLSGVYLPSSKFISANLYHSDFSSAYLRRGVFLEVNLQEANLMGANLEEALLSGGSLADADLSNADLQGVTIRNTSLKGTILYGTKLKGSVLENVNLKEIENSSQLDKKQLDQVARMCNVQLPRHITMKSNCSP